MRGRFANAITWQFLEARKAGFSRVTYRDKMILCGEHQHFAAEVSVSYCNSRCKICSSKRGNRRNLQKTNFDPKSRWQWRHWCE